MTAQVIATPPGTVTTYESGSRIPAEAGVVYQIADVTEDGTVGPTLNPLDLDRDPSGEDLVVTLPDGTELVFEGLVPVLVQGTGGGLAGPNGELVIASLEQAVAPAVGEETAPPSDSEGGSTQAFNEADPSDPRLFGEAPEGSFTQSELSTFAPSETDENLPLTNEDEQEPVVVATTSTGNGEPENGDDGGQEPPPPPEVAAADDQVVTNERADPIVLPASALLANDNGADLSITEVEHLTGLGDALLDAADQTVMVTDFVGLGGPADPFRVSTASFRYTITDDLGQTDSATVDLFLDDSTDFVVDGLDDEADGPGNGNGEIFVTTLNPGDTTTIMAGGGDDIVHGENSDVPLEILGGPGNDTLFGGNGDDTIDGGPGDDTIDVGGGSNHVAIADRAEGMDTLTGFDNVGAADDVLDLDALFDDLAADLGAALDTAARSARVSLEQDGADTNVFVDQSVAGDGSDPIQIAKILGTNASDFNLGDGAGDDIFVGA